MGQQWIRNATNIFNIGGLIGTLLTIPAAKYLGRKKLLWDAKNMKITNFDEANQFVKREYRDGYKIA